MKLNYKLIIGQCISGLITFGILEIFNACFNFETAILIGFAMIISEISFMEFKK